MIRFTADLHIHTVQSPCAGIEMIPPLIVETALARGVNLIAITDHNASGNVRAVMAAADGTGLTVLPGMELETSEEIHSLCLFDTLDQLLAWQKEVDALLPEMELDEEFYGSQLLVDPQGNFIKKDPRFRSMPAQMELQQACRRVNALGGLFIPAHITREANGLLSHLGTVPPDLETQILELSPFSMPENALRQYPELANYRLIQGSDAHFLEAITSRITFDSNSASISDLKAALLA